jgi:hypothetical protein
VLLTSAKIVVDGNAATADVIWTEVYSETLRTLPQTLEQGREHDELVKQGGRWYLKKTVVTNDGGRRRSRSTTRQDRQEQDPCTHNRAEVALRTLVIPTRLKARARSLHPAPHRRIRFYAQSSILMPRRMPKSVTNHTVWTFPPTTTTRIALELVNGLTTASSCSFLQLA